MSRNTIGIYPPDSIHEVASSLPIDPLGPGVADLLAADVEHRLHTILQEAKKFMVNGRRSCMLPQDVECAMEALNVEPVLIPPTPLPIHPFVQTPNPTPGQPLYHIQDDEIDFATYLKQPLPPGLGSSAGVKWKAHWLAVEGVQPAIPENPVIKPSATAQAPTPSTGAQSLKILAKSQLPQELQLYFTRLTTSLIPSSSTSTSIPNHSSGPSNEGTTQTESERHRLAALASLRNDVAISGLLVYVVRWWAESVNKCLGGSLGVLGWLIDAGEALVENHTLFLEPYLHQLLPPLLSLILTVPLGPHPPVQTPNQPTSFDIRSRASEVLGKIAASYGGSYVGLIPRLTSTLQKTLLLSPFPSPLGATTPPTGRYEGSVLGLAALGSGAVKVGLWGDRGEGVRRVDGLYTSFYGGRGKGGLMKASIKALQHLINPKPSADKIPPFDAQAILDNFGPNFVKALEKRPWMASELLRLKKEDTSLVPGEVPEGAEWEAGMEVDS